MAKKILITTHCVWKSNGSMLQALALKHFLESEFGADSIIAYDSQTPIVYENRKLAHSITGNIKLLVKRLLWGSKKKKLKEVFIKNHRFLQSYIDFVFFDGYNSLIKSPILDSFDLFIAGSDQIFHPDVCNPLFFLDHLRSAHKPMISYAASMGKTTISPIKESLFSKLLQNFDSISVRESDNIPVIRKYYGNNIQTNIDPTFLLDADVWRQYEEKYPINGKFFLVYPIYWDSSYNKQLKKLEAETGIRIVTISYGYTRAYGKCLPNVGVGEFLWLIDHSEGVISSSFHGVALSLIFGKKIAVVNNPDMPSRINSLLKTLCVNELSIEKLGDVSSFDFARIKKIINEEREKSRDYLERWLMR